MNSEIISQIKEFLKKNRFSVIITFGFLFAAMLILVFSEFFSQTIISIAYQDQGFTWITKSMGSRRKLPLSYYSDKIAALMSFLFYLSIIFSILCLPTQMFLRFLFTTSIKILIINLGLLFGVSSVMLIALVLILETKLRTQLDTAVSWHSPNSQFDSELGWANIPSGHTKDWGEVSSNSLGFRSAEILPNKKTIAFLGDSVAWGYGVNDSKTMSAELAALINKDEYQIQNLAVPGYGIDQYYLKKYQ